MTLNNDVRYYLIFDTNVLFQAYEKKADFTSFSFNSTYENIIDMINQLDIYSQVVLVIPSVVWGELEQQIIEKHDELLSKYINTIKNKVFPEYSIKENPPIDYSEYIKTKIKEYKSDIQQGMSEVIEKTMSRVSYLQKPTYEDYVATDAEARRIAEELI